MSPARRDFDSDITPDEAASIESAFALVLKLLPDLGAKGQECARTLAEAAQVLQGEEGLVTGKLDAFRAFHKGYVAKQKAGLKDDAIQTVWASNPSFNNAIIVGQKAARLNHLAEKPKGLFRRTKVGPFSESEVQSVFARAMVAVETSGKRMDDNR